MADGYSGLKIIDISNPTTPILKGSYHTNSRAVGVQVVGNYAYVGDGDGLQIIDISNPTTPILEGSYHTSSSAVGVQVVGNYAYVAGNLGLEIIDISNPTTPILEGRYDTSDYAVGVQVVGNYAYVANYGSGLQIIDISNPTTPILEGSYATSDYAVGVQVAGNYAYVADYRAGLQIIDISNPTTPIFKGNYDTSGGADGVQVIGNYAYVADDYSGLQIIDISNPTTPILKGSYDTSGSAIGVQVVGNYAYVADDFGGLKIIDVSDFTGNVTANQAPTNLSLSNNTIAENQALGTVIGTFTTTDPDTGNTFTYSLVTGTGSTDNALFTISGNQLQSNGIFDFETKNSYSIRVKTTDQGGLSYEKELTIGITNVDEQRSLSLTPQQDIFINEGLDDTVTGTFANLLQNDNINGGAGIDTLILSGGTSTDSLEIDASNSSNQLNIAGTTIANFERFDLSGFLGTISFSGYAGNNWIKSGAGNDELTGDSGNDYLNGGTGTDQLLGWKGNDTYVVDNTGDVIIEALNAGIDSVESSVTWTLKANLENLILTGTTAINGTGNQLNNILTGNSGNNTLNGALGIDTLVGGIGNDIYVVDTLTDTITENHGEGTDTIQSSVTYTIASLPNIENLTLTGSSVINGTGNAANNILTGNTANNTLNGGAGNDTLIGGAGKDTLTGGTGTDRFVFTSLADSLLAGYDVISDYTIGEQIDAPPTVAAVVLNTSSGIAASLAAANISSALGVFAANTAKAFTVTGQSGTFLAFNDATAAFNAATDSIVQLSGYNISAANTVTIV